MNERTLCFGDSLTKGHPGITYLKYFTNKNQYKNMGLSGDTLIGMTNRLTKTLNSKKYKDIAGIIVGIGANDIIQPFLNDYSWMWKLRVKMLHKRGSIPCSNNQQFEEEYIKMIKVLKKNNKKNLIFSIPYLETNRDNLNEKIKEYNKIIKDICMKYNVQFVDYYSWQVLEKSKQKTTGFAFMSKNPLVVGFDTLLTSYLQLTNYISKKRNLGLTIDGCHLNNYASSNLAKMIEKTYNE
ncbi:MAG: GDSL-type esterase/lipase family protein [Bacilli bacterium]|nr:GDSL-type esterase/lipase family protein [Bacilli bacterium]MDD4282737.1 GDSL-type esterase/lipase family protein [Bacilli bacterium]MDD4718998.1 GDSL-type esterase/lipase family protein [Bacilli bacterium]